MVGGHLGVHLGIRAEDADARRLHLLGARLDEFVAELFGGKLQQRRRVSKLKFGSRAFAADFASGWSQNNNMPLIENESPLPDESRRSVATSYGAKKRQKEVEFAPCSR